MALQINRQYRGRKKASINKRQSTIPASMALVTAVTFTVAVAEVTFDQPVMLNGFPASWRATGAPGVVPISAVQTSPTIIEVTFSATLAAATALEVTPLDPAVRTPTGGFASALGFLA
jgi:hypothetical protein